ncbi:MAG: hypothetical protein SPJ62_10905 [Inconstantimicrobium porci]|uniref:hypothetical protein n=1 Tax=Inconstantimicrobium porci TaxID=2652291 RepID=UPI002A90F02F|nr:hypothetical protein [Inconstantimicrobium porci]MDY5912487.1 hypothetical protein [Inconstantimicrobium porci]
MKSKQKAFLSSLIPGLGHIYIGLKSRGAIFILGFIFLISVSHISYGYDGSLGGFFHGFTMYRIVNILTGLAYFASILDCLICYDKIFAGKIDINDEKREKIENRRLISMFLSILPGCGHFLLGKSIKGKNYLMIFILLYLLSSIAGMEMFRIGIIILIILCILDIYNEKISLDVNKQEKEEDYSDKFRYIFIGAGAVLVIYTIIYGITNFLSYIGYTDIVTNINYGFNLSMNLLIGLILGFVLIREGYRFAEKREKELDATIQKEHQEEIDRESEENL